MSFSDFSNFSLTVSQYTGIENNRDIINNYHLYCFITTQNNIVSTSTCLKRIQ